VDVDHQLVAGELLQLEAELVHFLPALADHEARTRGEDMHLGLAAGALDVDLGDAGLVEALLDVVTQLEVFVKQLGVILAGVPDGGPILDDAEAEAVGMYFLSHGILLTSSWRRRRRSG
jgi:hypothetical protein